MAYLTIRFTARILAVTCALVAVVQAGAQAAGSDEVRPTLIDRVVASVGRRVITASDLTLDEVLRERDTRNTPGLETTAQSSLEALLDEAIIRSLAGDVPVYRPGAAELRARLDRLRQSWEDPADYLNFLSTFGLDEDRLEGILYSRMVVERYVHRAVGLSIDRRANGEDAFEQAYRTWIERERQLATIRIIEEGPPVR